jgi:hypothetical protein
MAERREASLGFEPRPREAPGLLRLLNQHLFKVTSKLISGEIRIRDAEARAEEIP